MNLTPEQLDELVSQSKKHGDVSNWLKEPGNAGYINLVSSLSNIPKANLPKPDLQRVRNKILDRISLPTESRSRSGLAAYVTRFMRITSLVVGMFMIMLSMTVGTAVAAMESVPGQTIYPLKKVFEGVQLKLATSDEQRTNLQLKFASNRIEELETVLQKNKQGKISDEKVQQVVASTANTLKQTTETVTENKKDQSDPIVLNKIVNLTNKNTAVLQAASISSEGSVKIEVDKAIEVSKSARELAIENIERAGLVVEEAPIAIVETKKVESVVAAEGKLTAVTSTSISIGTAQFTLTNATKYVNIKPVDLKVGLAVKISGEVNDKKTYAIEITGPVPAEEPEPEEPSEENPQEENQAPIKEPETVPLNP